MKSLNEVRIIKGKQRELEYQLRSITEAAIDETRDNITGLPLVEKDTLLALFIAREMGAPGLGPRIAEALRAIGL
jgi:hypothetical protein